MNKRNYWNSNNLLETLNQIIQTRLFNYKDTSHNSQLSLRTMKYSSKGIMGTHSACSFAFLRAARRSSRELMACVWYVNVLSPYSTKRKPCNKEMQWLYYGNYFKGKSSKIKINVILICIHIDVIKVSRQRQIPIIFQQHKSNNVLLLFGF